MISGTVEQISINHPSTSFRHQIGNVLDEFGAPSQVRIYVDTTPWDFALHLFLFFPEYDFIAIYRYDAKQSDDQITACVQPIGGRLVLVSSNSPWLLEDFIDVGIENTKSIEDATSLNIQTFSEAIQKTDLEACLTTPASFWP